MFTITLDSDVIASTNITYSLYQLPASGTARLIGDRLATITDSPPPIAINSAGNATLSIESVAGVTLVANQKYLIVLQGVKEGRNWGTGRIEVTWQPVVAPPPPPPPTAPPKATWLDFAGSSGTPNLYSISEMWAPLETPFTFDYYISGPTMAMNNSYQTWADPSPRVTYLDMVQWGAYRITFQTTGLAAGTYDFSVIARNDNPGTTTAPFKLHLGNYTGVSDLTNPRQPPVAAPPPTTPPPSTPPPPTTPPPPPPPTSGSFVPGQPPGSGWTRILEHTDPAVRVPNDFIGWHRDHSDKMGGPAQYPYSMARMLDWTDSSGIPKAYWAWINRTQNVYDWSGLDMFLDDNPGRKCPFTVFMTPAWLSTNTTQYPSVYGMYEFKWGAHPPKDWNKYREFLMALKNRYPPSRINAIEIWNEANTWDSTGNNPAKRNTELQTAFWRGDMYEMVTLHRIAREVFTDRPIWSGGWNDHTMVRLFLKTPDGIGGYGADHFDVFAFHSYMYSWNPTAAWEEAAAIKQLLRNAASALNRPRLNTVPMINTEIGHEGGRHADAKPKTLIARNLRRVCGLTAASLVAHNTIGIFCYSDKVTNSWTFWAPINDEPMKSAAIESARLQGMLMRQVYIKPGGVGTDDATTPIVWIRADDNSEYVA